MLDNLISFRIKSNVSSGGCDHIKPHPVYSDFNHSITSSWNKPWPPEIDWLDPYLNLSTLPEGVIDGIKNGFRVTKYAKYFETYKFGCVLMFQWDIELTDKYYLENFANANKSMLICTPDVAVDVGKREQYLQLFPTFYCWIYELGDMELIYNEYTWGHSWKYLRGEFLAALLIAATIAIAGILG